MSMFWKVLLGLALVLPVTAYVTGTLVASSHETPTDLSPVVIEDSPTPTTGSDKSGKPGKPGKSGDKKRVPGSGPGSRDDSGGKQRGDQDRAERDRVPVVTPAPTRIDDDDREDDDDDDDDSDDGPGDASDD